MRDAMRGGVLGTRDAHAGRAASRAIAARTASTSAPGRTRRSMRDTRPSRPKRSCAAAMSTTPRRCPAGGVERAGDDERRERGTGLHRRSTSPTATPEPRERGRRTGTRDRRRKRSSAAAPWPTSAGVTAAARNASTPTMRSGLVARRAGARRPRRPARRRRPPASRAIARDTPSRRSRRRGPRTTRSAAPDSVATPCVNSAIAERLTVWIAKPSATPSAIASRRRRACGRDSRRTRRRITATRTTPAVMRAIGDQPVRPELEHAVGVRRGGARMRDQHDGGAVTLHRVAQERDDRRRRCADRGCRSARRRARPPAVDQRACDRDALQLAAGQLARQARRAVGEPDRVEQRRDARIVRRIAHAVERERQRHVLADRQVGQHVERLEHEADALAAEPRARVVVERAERDAVDDDAAGVRHVEPGDQVEQRRLARRPTRRGSRRTRRARRRDRARRTTRAAAAPGRCARVLRGGSSGHSLARARRGTQRAVALSRRRGGRRLARGSWTSSSRCARWASAAGTSASWSKATRGSSPASCR